MANYLGLINCLRGLKTVFFCLSSDWVVFVNTWQKGGQIVDMWESYLFCLGGVEILFGRGRYYVSCFTLLIDLYFWVIHWYMFLFCVMWNQEFILFSCIFHTCVYASCLVFKEIYRLIQLSCCLHLQLMDNS